MSGALEVLNPEVVWGRSEQICALCEAAETNATEGVAGGTIGEPVVMPRVVREQRKAKTT